MIVSSHKKIRNAFHALIEFTFRKIRSCMVVKCNITTMANVKPPFPLHRTTAKPFGRVPVAASTWSVL